MLRSLEIAARTLNFGFGISFATSSGRGRPTDLLMERLPGLCSELGGAFPKIGQILSTRSDLLNPRLCQHLSTLQDDVAPMPHSALQRLLRRSKLLDLLDIVAYEPIASATIAQVHLARRADDGRLVALKVKRPEVSSRIRADCRIARRLARIVRRLPAAASIPVESAMSAALAILVQQTDFETEILHHERIQAIFAGEDIKIPGLHRDLCRPDIIVMDYLPGLRRITDPTVPEAQAKLALIKGLHALYRMIFEHGFVHCDMHPGNAMVTEDGDLALLDMGFMAAVDERTRLNFADFFLAIALRDGKTAAQIVKATATYVPSELDEAAFVRDITAIVARFGGLRAEEFQVVRFVSTLFAVQRRHKIVGTSTFTLLILALLVYEGVVKQRYCDLDFQAESIPYLLRCLATNPR